MNVQNMSRMPDEGDMVAVSPLYPNGEVLQSIGEICFLCFHSKTHSAWSMQMIAKMFEPAVFLKQFKVYRARNVPRGLVTFAKLGTDAEKEFASGKGLESPDDWNSGDNLWIVDLIAPWGHGREIIKDVLASIPEDSFRTLRNRNGQPIVTEWYRVARGGKWKIRTIQSNVFDR